MKGVVGGGGGRLHTEKRERINFGCSFRFECLGYGVQGFGWGVSGLGCGVQGLELKVEGEGNREKGLVFGVQGFEFRFSGLGFF